MSEPVAPVRSAAPSTITDTVEPSWTLTPSDRTARPAQTSVSADSDRVVGPQPTVAAAAAPSSDEQTYRVPQLPPPGPNALDQLADRVNVRRYGAQRRYHPNRDTNAALVDAARYELRSGQQSPRCPLERTQQASAGGMRGVCEPNTLIDAHLALGDHWSIGGQGGRERTQLRNLGDVNGAGAAYMQYGQLDVRYSLGQPGDTVRPFAEVGAGVNRVRMGFDGDGLPLGQRTSQTVFAQRATAGLSMQIAPEANVELGAEYRRNGGVDYSVRAASGQLTALNTGVIRDDARFYLRATFGFQSIETAIGNFER